MLVSALYQSRTVTVVVDIARSALKKLIPDRPQGTYILSVYTRSRAEGILLFSLIHNNNNNNNNNEFIFVSINATSTGITIQLNY